MGNHVIILLEVCLWCRVKEVAVLEDHNNTERRQQTEGENR